AESVLCFCRSTTLGAFSAQPGSALPTRVSADGVLDTAPLTMLLGPMYALVIKGASFAEASGCVRLATALRTVLEQRGSTLGTELTLVAILGTTLWTGGGDGVVLHGMATRVAAEIFDVEATAARAY
ncbi:unnamed protein product, partial [marine sediment metagenome]